MIPGWVPFALPDDRVVVRRSEASGTGAQSGSTMDDPRNSAGSRETGSSGCPRGAGCSLTSKRPQGRLVHAELLPPKAFLPPHAPPFGNGEFHLAAGQQVLPGLRLLLALLCRELSHLASQPCIMAASRLQSLASQPHMGSVGPFLIKGG